MQFSSRWARIGRILRKLARLQWFSLAAPIDLHLCDPEDMVLQLPLGESEPCRHRCVREGRRQPNPQDGISAASEPGDWAQGISTVGIAGCRRRRDSSLKSCVEGRPLIPTLAW